MFLDELISLCPLNAFDPCLTTYVPTSSMTRVDYMLDDGPCKSH
jgi:hypothetical protein